MGNIFINTNSVVTQSIRGKDDDFEKRGYRKINNFITWNGVQTLIDVHTFKNLGHMYAKDKNNIYYKGVKLEVQTKNCLKRSKKKTCKI